MHVLPVEVDVLRHVRLLLSCIFRVSVAYFMKLYYRCLVSFSNFAIVLIN